MSMERLSDNAIQIINDLHSYLSMQFMDDDDFCSYGERKDGDSNDK